RLRGPAHATAGALSAVLPLAFVSAFGCRASASGALRASVTKMANANRVRKFMAWILGCFARARAAHRETGSAAPPARERRYSVRTERSRPTPSLAHRAAGAP